MCSKILSRNVSFIYGASQETTLPGVLNHSEFVSIACILTCQIPVSLLRHSTAGVSERRWSLSVFPMTVWLCHLLSDFLFKDVLLCILCYYMSTVAPSGRHLGLLQPGFHPFLVLSNACGACPICLHLCDPFGFDT